MTGYFSQLARHTGLSFEPGAAMTGSSAASAPPAPPHIEEVIFTAAAPAPAAAEGNSASPADASSVGADSLLDRVRAAAGATDGDGTRNPRRRSAEEQSPAGEPRVVQPGERSNAERQPGPRESIEILPWEESRIAFTGSEPGTGRPRQHSAEEQSPAGGPIEITPESIEIVESRPEVKDSDPPQSSGVRESADAVRDEHLEREMIVHSYLKEVRAWVAAPPELDQREPEQRVAERPPAGHSDVFALEPEAEPTAPRSGRPDALEVQDLNLSIGTISIVVEEPKQTALAPLPVLPRADRSPDRPASEPTRLSRYYLERW